MKKVASMIAIVLVLSMLLSACGSNSTETQSTKNVESVKQTETQSGSDAKKTITAWISGPFKENYEKALEENPKDNDAKKTKAVMDIWYAQNPNITVNFENHGWAEELRQNLLISVMGGTGPDITMGETFIPEFARIGAFLSLDEFDSSSFTEGTLIGAKYNGKLYGVPFMTGVMALQYNKDVMKKAGLNPEEPPKTWEELITMCKTVTEAGKGEYHGIAIDGVFGVASALRFVPLARQFGGDFGPVDGTAATLNHPGNIKAYKIYRELAKYTPPGSAAIQDEGQVLSLTHKNKVAFQIDGSWQVDWTKSDGGANVGYAPLPVSEGGIKANVAVPNTFLSALKAAKEPELAKRFVMFMGRKDVQLAITGGDWLPAMKDAYMSEEAIKKHAELKIFIDEMDQAKAAGPLPVWSKNTSQVWDVWNELLIKVLTTEEPIQELADKAQEKAEKLLK